jgi:N-acetylglucosamine-6-phosphate deacetylase
LVRIVDVAPELDGAPEFIREASKLCTVSVAHTESGYDRAREAYAAGASHLTHLYNAMPGLHHRTPGVIPAAAEAEHSTCELICDGFHVHPAMVRLAFRMFGPERMVMISDARACCGGVEGEYLLGNQRTFLRDGVARLENGVIAGSATNLFDCMRRAMDMGIPEADAVRAATVNPARALGREALVGAIRQGLYADFLICRNGYTEKEVWFGGKPLEGVC